MAKEDKKGLDFDEDDVFQLVARVSMIRPEGTPLNRRPRAPPVPKWKREALDNLMTRNPRAQALRKSPSRIELEKDEEDLFRAYTGPEVAAGSSSRNEGEASSSLK